MRIAAVALVLVIGAAVVLAFANTLNSWVVGGLLGGLAAILLSIPLSLALFTLLARRQEILEREHTEHIEEDQYGAVEELDYVDEDQVWLEEGEHDDYEDDGYTPRQARRLVRSVDEDEYGTHYGTSAPQAPTPPNVSRRDLPTRHLAQYQSAALRQASREAMRQANNGRSTSQLRRDQANRGRQGQRPATSRNLRSQSSNRNNQRHLDEYDTYQPRLPQSQSLWEQEDRSEDLYQHYPRRPSYPRNPRQPRYVEPENTLLEDDDEEEYPQTRRSRRSNEPSTRNLRGPLVRRAPYLYDDDPMRDEFAQQLDPDHPIARRTSRYEGYGERD